MRVQSSVRAPANLSMPNRTARHERLGDVIAAPRSASWGSGRPAERHATALVMVLLLDGNGMRTCLGRASRLGTYAPSPTRLQAVRPSPRRDGGDRPRPRNTGLAGSVSRSSSCATTATSTGSDLIEALGERAQRFLMLEHQLMPHREDTAIRVAEMRRGRGARSARPQPSVAPTENRAAAARTMQLAGAPRVGALRERRVEPTTAQDRADPGEAPPNRTSGQRRRSRRCAGS